MVSATSSSIFVSLVILSFLSLVVVTTIGGHTEDEMKECKKVSRRTLKQILKDLGVCNTEWKGLTKSPAEHSRKMGCVVRCILKKQKMLDDRGLVTNATLQLAVGDRAQGKFRDIVVHLFHECDNKFGKSLDPKDEFCLSYSIFGNCIQDSIADMCHVEIPF